MKTLKTLALTATLALAGTGLAVAPAQAASGPVVSAAAAPAAVQVQVTSAPVLAPARKVAPPTATMFTFYYKNAKTGLKLRKSKSTSSLAVGYVPNGGRLYLTRTGTQGAWTHVAKYSSFQNRILERPSATGWVQTKYLGKRTMAKARGEGFVTAKRWTGINQSNGKLAHGVKGSQARVMSVSGKTAVAWVSTHNQYVRIPTSVIKSTRG